MKQLFALPLAALAVGLVACSDAQETFSPQFELVDPTQRIDADDVNAHVYGSFALQFTEVIGGEARWEVINDGPANFPGNPKNAGECDNGLWINPKGKRTSGSQDKPHPHCVRMVEGSREVTIQVVLEPISAQHNPTASSGAELLLADPKEAGRARIQGSSGKFAGQGIVVAYAIDAATLGGTNRRVGTMTFDMAQYNADDTNYFDTDCTVGLDETAPRCLDLLINATYAPLAENGVGELTENVTGFLYWSPATAPFNYGGN